MGEKFNPSPNSDKTPAETPAQIESGFDHFFSPKFQHRPEPISAPSVPSLPAVSGDACSVRPGQVPCPGGAAVELPGARKADPLVDVPRVTSRDDFSRNVSAPDDRSVNAAPIEPLAPPVKGEPSLGTSLEITPPVYTQPERVDQKRKDADAPTTPSSIDIPFRIQPAPVETKAPVERPSLELNDPRQTPAERLLTPEKTTRIEAPQVGEPERVQAPALPVRSDKDAPAAPIEKLYTQPIQSDTRQSEPHVPTFQPEAPLVVTPRVEPIVKTEPAARKAPEVESPISEGRLDSRTPAETYDRQPVVLPHDATTQPENRLSGRVSLPAASFPGIAVSKGRTARRRS